MFRAAFTCGGPLCQVRSVVNVALKRPEDRMTQGCQPDKHGEQLSAQFKCENSLLYPMISGAYFDATR